MWIWCVQMISKKLKQNQKQCDMTCLPMLPYLGHESLGGILKKYLHKDKSLMFI